MVQFSVLTRQQACDDVHTPYHCWPAEEVSGEELMQVIRGTGRSRRTSITASLTFFQPLTPFSKTFFLHRVPGPNVE